MDNLNYYYMDSIQNNNNIYYVDEITDNQLNLPLFIPYNNFNTDITITNINYGNINVGTYFYKIIYVNNNINFTPFNIFTINVMSLQNVLLTNIPMYDNYNCLLYRTKLNNSNIYYLVSSVTSNYFLDNITDVIQLLIDSEYLEKDDVIIYSLINEYEYKIKNIILPFTNKNSEIINDIGDNPEKINNVIMHVLKNTNCTNGNYGVLSSYLNEGVELCTAQVIRNELSNFQPVIINNPQRITRPKSSQTLIKKNLCIINNKSLNEKYNLNTSLF
jgi:hypothetical protein